MAARFQQESKQLDVHDKALLVGPQQVKVKDLGGRIEEFNGDTAEVRSHHVNNGMKDRGERMASLDGYGAQLGGVSQDSQDYLVRVLHVDTDVLDQVRVEGVRERHGIADVTFDSTAAPYRLYPGKVFKLTGFQKSHGQPTIRGTKVTNPTPLPTTHHRSHATPTATPSKRARTETPSAPRASTVCQPFSLFVAAGPFGDDMGQTVAYIERIVRACIKKGGVGAILIVGPLSRDRGPLGKTNVTSALEEDSMLAFCPDDLIAKFGKAMPKLIFVSSTEDVFHEFVYPQPGYSFDLKHESILSLTNPGRFEVNGVDFGVTSLDLLRALRMEMVLQEGVDTNVGFAAPASAEENSLKPAMRAALEEVLSAASFYPILPPKKGVPLDVSLVEHLEFGASTPDVLILPSMLTYADAVVLDSESPEDRVVC